MTNACILTIGDEILLGQITDTNAQFIANALSSIGIQVVVKITVGDSRTEVWEALQFAFQKTQVVIVTGGLGPTKDDLTKQILADWFHSPLEVNSDALEHLENLLRKRGREINDLIRTQADQPVKAEYLKNEVGTAPGMWFAEDEKICVALPGVPYEMKQILMDEVVPRLKERLKLDVILHQFIRTVGVPETLLAQKIDTWEEALPDFLKLAYLPGGGQVKLRLTARGSDSVFLKKELKRQTDLVLPLIKDYVYSTEDIELETIVAQMIVTHELTLQVDDQITDGVLFQKFQAFPEVQKMLLSSKMDFLETPDQSKNLIQIRILKDVELETQQIVLVWGEIRVQTQVKPFPHPEVNRNVVSLVTLNLLRKIILEKWPESKSSN